MKKNKHKKYANKIKPLSPLSLIPIIMALSIVPLIVRLKVLDIPKANIVWAYKDMNKIYDLFAYEKGILLIIAALIAIGLFIYNYLTTRTLLPNEKYYYLVYIYTGLVILSFIFSVNKSVSLTGYVEHFENVFVLLAYVVLFIYTSLHIVNQKHIQWIIYTWIGSILIMFLIGLTQYFGHDFFFTNLGKVYMLPKSLRFMNINQDTDQVRNVYQTLFHYNYVSFYAAIALPFFLCLALLEKNIKLKITYGIVTLIMILNQFFSLSRNGFIGIFASLIFVAILLRGSFMKYWKIILPLITMALIGSTLFIATSNSATATRIVAGLKGMTQTIDYPLNQVTANEEHIIIDHDHYYVKIKYEPSNEVSPTVFNFYDQSGQIIDLNYAKETNNYLLPQLKKGLFSYQYASFSKMPALIITINNKKWQFVYSPNPKGFYYINPARQLVRLEESNAIGFEGRERFASARGYIWSRTLPIVFEHWLLGTGPDTFPLAFPQDDYTGKLNAYNNPTMLVDKPHSIYLGYAISSGLPSLIALLALWIYYILWSMKLYLRASFDSYYAKIGAASLTAIIGYLASGLFNDTNQNVTPVFWIILGIGFAVNRLYRAEVQNN